MTQLSRPTDLCVVLCSFPSAWDGWLSADEIAGRLGNLGFAGLRAQTVEVDAAFETERRVVPLRKLEGGNGA